MMRFAQKIGLAGIVVIRRQDAQAKKASEYSL